MPPHSSAWGYGAVSNEPRDPPPLTNHLFLWGCPSPFVYFGVCSGNLESMRSPYFSISGKIVLSYFLETTQDSKKKLFVISLPICQSCSSLFLSVSLSISFVIIPRAALSSTLAQSRADCSVLIQYACNL